MLKEKFLIYKEIKQQVISFSEVNSIELKDNIQQNNTIDKKINNFLVKLKNSDFLNNTTAGNYNLKTLKNIFLKSDLYKEIHMIISEGNQYNISLIEKKKTYFNSIYVTSKIIKLSPSKKLKRQGFKEIYYDLANFRYDNFNFYSPLEEDDHNIKNSNIDLENNKPENNEIDIRLNNIRISAASVKVNDNESFKNLFEDMVALIEDFENLNPVLQELNVEDITPLDIMKELEEYIIVYEEELDSETLVDEVTTLQEDFFKQLINNLDKKIIEPKIFEKYMEMFELYSALIGAKYKLDLD